MKTYTATPDFYRDYLCHYNHNHDPKTGQFTTGKGRLINGYASDLPKPRKFYTIAMLEKDAKTGRRELTSHEWRVLSDSQVKYADRDNPGFKEWYEKKDPNYEKYDVKNPEKHVEEFKKEQKRELEKEEVKNNLNKPWDYKNESYDDYTKRLIRAYDEYSKTFSNETKKAEKELDSAIKGVTPKDGNSSSAIDKYSGIAGLLSYYYDEDNFEDTARQMWFYKYEDGDQGSDNSAMAQLVSNYGYEDAEKRINKYRISERNLEESLINDFGKDEANKLMEARRQKDNNKTNYHIYRLNDGEISAPKKRYDEAIKKAKLLDDVVTLHIDVNSAANKVANKIKSARKSGLTYEEIADRYGVSTGFISDVLNNY